MNLNQLLKPIAVQFIGQAVLGALAYYWLTLGVATTAMVALNALLAVVLVLAWSALDAYGLAAPAQWWRAIPAVVLMPLMGVHVGLAILVPFLWLVLLFPSVAAGRWRVLLSPVYLAVSVGILLAITVLPAALLNWIPSLTGFRSQAVSFGLRSLLAYTIFAGGWAVLLQYIAGQTSKGESRS